MSKLSNIYFFTIVSFLFLNYESKCDALDLNKETTNSRHDNQPETRNDLVNLMTEALNKANAHPDWSYDALNRNSKRPLEEYNALLNEAVDDDLLNLSLRSIDKEKLQNSPWLQYIVIRKETKRGHDYIPRLGRGSTPEEEDNSAQLRNQNTPLFAPRLGKKSLEFSPRLGRSYFSE